MVQELGLESEVIVPSRVSKVRLIFHEGQVQRLPNSPIGLLTSDLIRPKALSFLKDLFVTKAKVDKWNAANNGDDDVSIHDFISRHFGAELSEDIIAGVVVGIYAGNAKRLSAKSCFSSLHSVEQNHGSLIRGILSGKGVKKSARASDLARRIKVHLPPSPIECHTELYHDVPRLLVVFFPSKTVYLCSPKRFRLFTTKI
jgi:oxygen-dependent protoporphyrinogen oxidase